MAKVSDRVRSLRKEHGLTQEEVARRAGLTLNSYGGIERGHVRDPHLSSLEAIARALGVSIQALVSEEMAAPLIKAPDTGRPDEERSAHNVVARDEVLRQWEQNREAVERAFAAEGIRLPVQLSDMLGPYVTLAEAEEEQHIIPQSPANLRRHIREMKELKELRKAQMEELGKGVGLPEALLSQMALADKGLRDFLAELGVLGFAEAVRAGREMAEPEAIPLCHELLRRLEDLEKLSAEAQAASGVAEAYIDLAVTKGVSGAESFLAEQTAPEGG